MSKTQPCLQVVYTRLKVQSIRTFISYKNVADVLVKGAWPLGFWEGPSHGLANMGILLSTKPLNSKELPTSVSNWTGMLKDLRRLQVKPSHI